MYQLKRNKHKLIVLVFIFLSSCSDSQNYFDEKEIVNRLTSDKSLGMKYNRDSYGELTGITSKYDDDIFQSFFVYKNRNGNRRLDHVVTYLDTTLFGHNFKFYENGRLAEYWFNIGKSNFASYVVEFNKNGNVTGTLGTPLVFHQSNDVRMQLFFSKILFDSLTVEQSNDGRSFRAVNLLKSKLQPGILETISPANSKTLILKIHAYGMNGVNEYRDSVQAIN